jgi:hypothetical protein
LTASPSETVLELVRCIVNEFRLGKTRLTLAGSYAEVDPLADVTLLEGDILIVEDDTFTPSPRSGQYYL